MAACGDGEPVAEEEADDGQHRQAARLEAPKGGVLHLRLLWQLAWLEQLALLMLPQLLQPPRLRQQQALPRQLWLLRQLRLQRPEYPRFGQRAGHWLRHLRLRPPAGQSLWHLRLAAERHVEAVSKKALLPGPEQLPVARGGPRLWVGVGHGAETLVQLLAMRVDGGSRRTARQDLVVAEHRGSGRRARAAPRAVGQLLLLAVGEPQRAREGAPAGLLRRLARASRAREAGGHR
mmetsp:Transcript_30988/g.98949  ORF Transcript_30988/g.98949 Transcript_30988/m.98949 type:complete len:234 (+) Transcript_30988:1064-1765(+)